MSNEIVSLKKVILHLNTLTFSSTQILLFTILPYLSDQLAIPLATIIGSFALGSALFLWGAPFWSSKSDFLGREKVLTLGLMGLSVSFIMIVFINSLASLLTGKILIALLIISRIIYGSIGSAIIPVTQLIHASLANNDNKMASMFSHSLSLNLGRALGPMLLLLWPEEMQTLLIAIAIWSIILVFINTLLPSHHSLERENDTTEVIKIEEWQTVIRMIWLPLLLTILFTTYTGMLHSSLGNTLQVIFSLNGPEASKLMAQVLLLGSLVMVISQIVGKILLKKHLKEAFSAGLCSLIIGVVTFAFIHSHSQVWIGIVFISMGIALLYPSHLALVHIYYPQKSMGKYIGLLSSGNTLGYALGGSLASLLLNYDINKISVIVVSLISVVAIMGLRRMKVC